MLSPAAVEVDVLKNPEVDVAVPRIHGAEPLRDLPAIRAQVVVLLDEAVQSRPLIRDGNRLSSAHERSEQDFTLVARDVDEIVAALPIDRKSTRLNSSHLVMSYAVVCLKKKPRATGSRTWTCGLP